MKTLRHLLVLLLVFTAGSGCGRAFQDVGEASIDVVAPDPSVAVVESSIVLELDVTSVRDVTQVTSSHGAFALDSGTQRWMRQIPLNMGLNRVIIEAFVDDGPTKKDTISFLRLSYTHDVITPSPLPFSTGSHSISLVGENDLLLVGGIGGAGEGASLDAHIWPGGTNYFHPIVEFSKFPRVGHSTAVLPDGRVLIVGGAVRGDIEEVNELISHIEIFNPADRSFKLIPFQGNPIRRMYHTSILRSVNGQTVLDLLGGRGDTRYTPSPLLGIRQDLRSFVFRNDSLIALSPDVGPLIEPLAGHTQTQIDGNAPNAGSRYLVNGLRFDTETKPSSFIMDYSSPFGISMTQTSKMNEPRIRHASVRVAPGVVAIFGGRAEDPNIVYGTGELFVEAANAYFTLPFSITPRFGHTATRLNNGRIVILGGFDATSNSLDATDFVSLVVE